MFCSQCQAFISKWNATLIDHLDKDGQLVYQPFSDILHNNIDRLRASSDAGCVICRNVWNSITEKQQSSIPSQTAVSLAIAPDQGKPILKAAYVNPDGTPSPLGSHMMAMFLRVSNSPRLSTLLDTCNGDLDKSHTGSEASFKIADYWLSGCLENHASCPKPIEWLPSRVLDVGEDVDGLDVKLVETKELDEVSKKQPYVALSHCWGLERFIITTTETLPTRKTSIPVKDLPPSFQDAVQVVRRMKMRYLWIDSLCIIQDSKSDWEAESVLMCEIYARAIFTITSAHASGAFGGMFVRRDGIRTLPFEIELRLPDASAVRLMFLPTPRREIVWDTKDLPIYTRAWCFQELILSTRNLIFDPDGVRWECLTSSGSERDPEGGIRRHHSRVRELQIAINTGDPVVDAFKLLGDDIQNQSMNWHHIVQDYSSRNLTKYTDRLIAIAGVAEALIKRSKNEYCAGLWKDDLYMQLAWYVRHLANPASTNVIQVERPPPYREPDAVAPTWSWASVNVPVIYDGASRAQRMCEVMNVTLEGTPQIQKGPITLRGDTRQLFVTWGKKGLIADIERIHDKYKFKDSYGLMQGLLRPDDVMLVSNKPPTVLGSLQAMPTRFHPEETIDEGLPLTFIAIMRRPRFSGMSLEQRRPSVYTLAVVPTGVRGGEYRRVGLAVWSDCSWFGYDCAEDRELKAPAYRKLGRPWSKIKPPDLAVDPGHRHQGLEELDGLPDESIYHAEARMRRVTMSVI